MPPSFCLLPKLADQFLEKIKSGELDPADLATMSSAERRAALAEVVGGANAEHVNAAFESKLLLKNQKAGIETWIKETGGLKPDVKRDMLARVGRMEQVLEPADLHSFLEDLAKQKLGFGVTMEEAGTISALSKSVAEAKAALLAGGDRMAYGRARVAFGNYVAELTNAVPKPRTVKSTINDVAGFSKSILASFDNSALLRQGWKNLWAHPEIWARNAKQSFVDLVQQFGGHEVMDEVNADILSRPNAVNGRYERAGLALGKVEEQFPSTLPEKIPVLGRAYKASEVAFNAFQFRSRADVFDKYMEIAEKSGVDLRDKAQLQGIGSLVNSLTARGDIGKFENLNFAFFSLRKFKSDWDFLTMHAGDAKVTPFVRRQAAINLVKVVTGTAGVLAVARAVKPESVEPDARSTDFGRIKVGDTRFDVTGGMGSLAVLGARLAAGSTKTAATGKITPLNSGAFDGPTREKLVYNFFTNKFSPAAGVVRDLLRGEDFDHNPVTVGGTIQHLAVPLPIANVQELANDPNSANIVLATLADALGISVNTYGAAKKATKH